MVGVLGASLGFGDRGVEGIVACVTHMLGTRRLADIALSLSSAGLFEGPLRPSLGSEVLNQRAVASKQLCKRASF